MPTKSLQLDGPDLEELLARAMNEAGPGGRVASADRVRKGGIGGFFAREHFEVTIEFEETEVADGAGRAASTATDGTNMATGTRSGGAATRAVTDGTARAQSWSELADVTEDVLEITTSTATTSTVTTSTSTATTSSSSAAEDLLAADDSVTPAPAQLGSESRLPSTQKASFAAMLSAIARETVAEPESAGTPLGLDPLSGFGATSVHAAPTASGGEPSSEPAVALDSPVVTGSSHLRATGAAAGNAWIEAIAAAAPEGGTEAGAAPAPAPDATVETAVPMVAADLFTSGAESPVATASASLAEIDLTAVTIESDEPDESGIVEPALQTLGLPRDLLPEPAVLSCLDALRWRDDAEMYVQVALTTALQQLPEATEPPLRPGNVLVAVGDLDRAYGFAAAVADRANIDLDTIVVASRARHRLGTASRHPISSPEEAMDLAARSRRMPHGVIVALHAPVSAEPDHWAARMLSALAPTAVWGVTSATHKSEDLAAWAECLGGLDALALEDLAATTSPADALASGVPIARLDGQRATPALWAALIAARLLLTSATVRHAQGTGA